jgi:hypothetical protein
LQQNIPLPQELEWISGKTRILIRHRQEWIKRYLDIHLDTDYPKKKPHMMLMLDLHVGWVRVTDLQNNGFGSSIQNCGYGTLAVNTAIQALRLLHRQDQQNPDGTDNPTLYGSVSSTGDPDNEPHRSECWQRRNHFWSRFGFKLHDPSVPDTGMEARLTDIKELRTCTTANGSPRWVDIGQFWPPHERPLLLPGVKEALTAITPSSLELHDSPSTENARTHRRKAASQAHWIGRVGALIVIAITYFTIKDLSSMSVMLAAAAFGTGLSFVANDWVTAQIFARLPSYSTWEALDQRRKIAIKDVCQTIIQIEESCNGLFWRVFEAMVVLKPELQAETRFVEISNWSKQGTIRLYVDRAFDIDEYRRFISLAQAWMAEQANQLDSPLSTVSGDNPLDNALKPAELDAIEN